MDLQTPISDAGRAFKMYASRLAKLGIFTLGDLLYHKPARYEDYSIVSKIESVQPGEKVTIEGDVIDLQNVYIRGGRSLQKAKIADPTGTIEVTWFNQPFLLKNIRKGDRISIAGEIDRFGKKTVLQPSQYEMLGDSSNRIHTGKLIPIYPETKGVSSKWLRGKIARLLTSVHIEEYLPQKLLEDNELMSIQDAISFIHFPKNLDEADKARKRLAFDELLLMQLSGMTRRQDWKKTLAGPKFQITQHKNLIEDFWEKLPFTLTSAQKRAVQEIFKDLASKKPMNRLLEGDVGSGKTVVGAIGMYLSYLNGFQSVLMAPTEILANQHYATISNLLAPLGVKVGLSTGSKKIKNSLASYDILIGTHAVLSKNSTFESLGLVIIDEQQRFGVEQRAIIRKKGQNPHVLTMTATPIPRTVALTMYGDLDLSYLDEMPKGRKKVKTWLVPAEKRNPAYEWIEKQIKKLDDQAFIVCPFIEESETLTTVKAAKKEYEHLKKDVFPHLALGLLHGKLKSEEKKKILRDFRNKKFDILVTTPLVEVGIDIPNATIIVVEAADRFGLAQLHQLRGRVGRGDKQSYCLLFTDSQSENTLKRLEALQTVYVGAKLAELDLKLRGPGDIYGTMQHGVMKLKMASFSDAYLIEQTKKEAEKLLPILSSYKTLQAKLKSLTIKEVAQD